MFLLTGPELRFEFANEAYRALTGNRELIGKRVRDVFPELEEQGFLRLLDEVYRTGQAYRATAAKVSFPRSEGGEIEDLFVDFVFQPVRNADDDVTGIFVQANDVTEHKRTERLRGLQNRILELAIEDCSLADALEQLILAVEAYSSSGMLGSVLLLDSAAHRLRHGAAPNLPSDYNEAIDGIEIGPNVGSCGTAASTGSPVYVSDIGSDPLWADFRELALSHGLRACWSTPIRSNQGKVLGTFADLLSRTAVSRRRRPRADRFRQPVGEPDHPAERSRTAASRGYPHPRNTASNRRRGRRRARSRKRGPARHRFRGRANRRGIRRLLLQCRRPQGRELHALHAVRRRSVGVREISNAAQHRDLRADLRGEGIVRSDDITKDPRYGKNPPYHGMPEGHLPVTSYLAVPVKGRAGDVIGGLFFGHSKPGQFEERHEILMKGIAAQAAIAIDNARLFGEAQGEIERRHEAEEALRTLNATLESRVVEEIERRAKAEDALRQSQKMETVGQLSGGIAHDFNNLLQIIHGNLTLLQGAIAADEPKWQRSIVNALTGTERAAALTQRLLAFSRRQPLDARPVDINQMIADMIELLHRTLGETIVIETRLASDVPTALVDANQLENAILNLAINARDAMPRGGVLEISTDIAELDSAAATANADASPGRYVRITVGDTGEGMSPEVLSRAVEPFFSTKEVGQGTGLGLSMVYGFARQSGGHLVVNSVESEGTTIELYVPCSSEVAEPRADKPERSELPAGKGERILLCEDDPDVRRFSSETLADLGYEVIEAHDADSALHALRNSKPIDLLFTDIVLPGGRNGADLAREARLLQTDLKVLFATGYARSALEERQDRGSGLALLLKPFGVEELATKLRTMLDT